MTKKFEITMSNGEKIVFETFCDKPTSIFCEKLFIVYTERKPIYINTRQIATIKEI